MNRRLFIQKAVTALVAASVETVLPRKSCGHVSWCYLPPRDVSWQVHKFSVLDSFDCANNFIYASGQVSCDRVYRVGAELASILVVLPQFESNGLWERVALPADRPTDIGKIGINTVRYDPRMGDDDGEVEVGRYYVPIRVIYPSPYPVGWRITCESSPA